MNQKTDLPKEFERLIKRQTYQKEDKSKDRLTKRIWKTNQKTDLQKEKNERLIKRQTYQRKTNQKTDFQKKVKSKDRLTKRIWKTNQKTDLPKIQAYQKDLTKTQTHQKQYLPMNRKL